MEPRAFLRKRFRAKLVKRSDTDHWAGGKPYHQGANCPACKIPLLLLWDINCKDPRFPRLYYCWGCVNDLSYQVFDDGKIHIHLGKRSKGPSFPYDPYPEFLERRGLNLLDGSVPDEIRRAVLEMYASWDTAAGDAAVPVPKPKDRKMLNDFFGHPADVPMSLFYHQFGGRPLQQLWANEKFRCPNPTCVGSPADRLRGTKRAMKFLAGILYDPWGGLPMGQPANAETKKHWDFFISVQFHICDCCWTIHGCNRY
jgi:hypothetical protein